MVTVSNLEKSKHYQFSRGVSDSVVIVDQQGEHEVLHAYYVGDKDIKSDIVRQLNQYLPKYMIPKLSQQLMLFR